MKNCIGVDVAKRVVDVHVLKDNRQFRFGNDAEGIQNCLALCQKEQPELIVMEATGGYEALLAGHLQAQGFAVAVVNPRRIRDFARAAGQLPAPGGEGAGDDAAQTGEAGAGGEAAGGLDALSAPTAGASRIEQVRALVNDDPRRVANVVRSWVSDDG